MGMPSEEEPVKRPETLMNTGFFGPDGGPVIIGGSAPNGGRLFSEQPVSVQ
jgi:hypothetical protein